MAFIDTILRTTILECCTRLMAGYGFCVVDESDDASPNEIVAVIGFASDQMKGALGLAGSRELVQATLDSISSVVATDAQLSDWLGELSNQLLGRIKMRLLELGIEIQLATPVVLRGVRLTVLGTSDAARLKYALNSSFGSMSIWLDIWQGDGLETTASSRAVEELVPEGELLLF